MLGLQRTKRKKTTILSHHINANKNSFEINFTPVRKAKVSFFKKTQITTNAGMNVGKGNTYSILEGVQIGLTTLEISVMFCQKARNRCSP